MKKSLKITLIVIGVLVGIVAVDTLQAKIFNNSPILKVRENLNGDRTAYIDKGVFVNHYYCINKEEKTLFKGAKYTCPELEENKESRNKQTISLRLSPKALETAKSLGKGYTSVLSRILENALKDKKTIEKYL